MEGLVLDPNDPTVIGLGLAGINPPPFFKGLALISECNGYTLQF